MVDCEARQAIASLLARLFEGEITDWEFHDGALAVLAHVCVRDRLIAHVTTWGASQGLGIGPVRLMGAYAPSQEQRDTLERVLLFLHTAEDYMWPLEPSEMKFIDRFHWRVLNIATFGSHERHRMRGFSQQLWPFASQEQLDEACTAANAQTQLNQPCATSTELERKYEWLDAYIFLPTLRSLIRVATLRLAPPIVFMVPIILLFKSESISQLRQLLFSAGCFWIVMFVLNLIWLLRHNFCRDRFAISCHGVIQYRRGTVYRHGLWKDLKSGHISRGLGTFAFDDGTLFDFHECGLIHCPVVAAMEKHCIHLGYGYKLLHAYEAEGPPNLNEFVKRIFYILFVILIGTSVIYAGSVAIPINNHGITIQSVILVPVMLYFLVWISTK